jgi:hypothetical protein
MMDGNLKRRLEAIVGGPARPFDLTVAEAVDLAEALGPWMAQLRESDVAPDDVRDLQSDSEHLAALHDLRQRLYLHAGFTRRPRP